jgi:hypothetical protein
MPAQNIMNAIGQGVDDDASIAEVLLGRRAGDRDRLAPDVKCGLLPAPIGGMRCTIAARTVSWRPLSSVSTSGIVVSAAGPSAVIASKLDAIAVDRDAETFEPLVRLLPCV